MTDLYEWVKRNFYWANGACALWLLAVVAIAPVTFWGGTALIGVAAVNGIMFYANWRKV